MFNLFLNDTQDGLLKRKDFKTWSKRNDKLVSKWEKDLTDKSPTMYEEEGFLTREKAEAFGKSYKKNNIKPKMKEFKDHVHLFKNYLKDFSSLNEPGMVNVKFLDELMIWAAMLGLTKEVYKEFKALYPKYEQVSVYSYRSISAALIYANRINHDVSSRIVGPVVRLALAVVAVVAVYLVVVLVVERDNVQNMIRSRFISNRFFLCLNIA